MNKRKRLLPLLAIIAGIIIGLYVIAHVTGALRTYKVPTSSSFPTINPGDRIFGSRLLSAKRYDLITFYHRAEGEARNTFVSRLCGMPGDTLQLKDGNLYINGHSADDSLNLNFTYQVPNSSLPAIAEKISLNNENAYPGENDTAVVELTTEQLNILKQLKIPYKRYSDFDKPNDEITAQFHQPWTPGNFGPVRVPDDHYFVLGDNRYNAMDSRFIGFIPKKDVTGVVLNRH
jgi:signal peptidase I